MKEVIEIDLPRRIGKLIYESEIKSIRINSIRREIVINITDDKSFEKDYVKGNINVEFKYD